MGLLIFPNCRSSSSKGEKQTFTPDAEGKRAPSPNTHLRRGCPELPKRRWWLPAYTGRGSPWEEQGKIPWSVDSLLR